MTLPINPNPPEVLHVDLNAAFARAEQQAMPLWRGKPLGVTPFASDGGCVISPSYELKAQGVTTAMRIRDARMLSPNMVLRQSNPPLYREVHRRFCKIFREYSPDVVPKSIDEAVIFLRGTPALKSRSMEDIGMEIKAKVKKEIGPWMLVNVGIGTNAFFAKTAAGLHKPDGLDRMDAANARAVYAGMQLTDLCGISDRYAARLNAAGIFTPLEFLDADAAFLMKQVFRSVEGYYWHRKLRGYEIEAFEHDRASFGNSVTLDRPVSDVPALLGVANMLCHKASTRMRRDRFQCRSVQLMLRYADGTHFRHHVTLKRPVSSLADVFRAATLCFNRQPGGGGTANPKSVTKVMVDLFNVEQGTACQESLFEAGDVAKERRVSDAMDSVNHRYGMFALKSGAMVGAERHVWDRIPFGSVQDLEELYADHEPALTAQDADWGA